MSGERPQPDRPDGEDDGERKPTPKKNSRFFCPAANGRTEEMDVKWCNSDRTFDPNRQNTTLQIPRRLAGSVGCRCVSDDGGLLRILRRLCVLPVPHAHAASRYWRSVDFRTRKPSEEYGATSRESDVPGAAMFRAKLQTKFFPTAANRSSDKRRRQ